MSRKFVADFIKIYESEPCLWQVNSKDYHDRDKKEAGYAKLIGKMNEIEPNATKDSVIKKINNLRSAFRKEKKKMKESLKSGASADSVYKPKLWYFSLLSFLCDQNTSRSNTDISNKPLASTSTSSPPTSRAQLPKKGTTIADAQDLAKEVRCVKEVSEHFKRSHSEDRFDEIGKTFANIDDTQDLAKEVRRVKEVRGHFERSRTEEDRFDVIGKTFAIKLRGLPKQQMLLAEKLMNETLFQAEMGYLTLSHRLVGEENPHLLPRYFSPVPYQGSPASSPTSYNSQTHSSSPSPSPQAGMHQQLHHEHNQEFQSNVPYGNVPLGSDTSVSFFDDCS